MKVKASHIPQDWEVPQLEFAQIFTVSSIWQEFGKDKETATFDLTIRDMPGERNFLLLSGIEEVVRGILNWHYDSGYLDFLLRRKIISKKFADYLREFKFTGDLWAMPEGTVFFPGEPVIRISAPLIEANMLTAFLSNCICYPTLYLSKAVRVKLAAQNKPIIVTGSMRANGFEALMKSHRLAYLLGSSMPVPYSLYRLGVEDDFPVDVTLYHALIKSFPTEQAAYRAIVGHVDAAADLSTMIDTYNLRKGMQNFIEVEKEANQVGRSLGWVVVDSGPILKTARWIRRELDKAGLKKIKIAVASNLDENKIAQMVAKKAPIDVYAAITEVINISDRPVLEAVYKLAETITPDGKVIFTAKLTPGKQSLPGRKQVFRQYGKDGKMYKDIIGLENEALGDPLLIPYIQKGKAVDELPEIEDIKHYLNKQLAGLPEKLKQMKKVKAYPVETSPKIKSILGMLKKEHSRS